MRPIIWSHTRKDIRTLLKVKIGFESAVLTQQYQALADIASAALGGKKGKSRSGSKPTGVFEPQTADQLASKMTSMGLFG